MDVTKQEEIRAAIANLEVAGICEIGRKAVTKLVESIVGEKLEPGHILPKVGEVFGFLPECPYAYIRIPDNQGEMVFPNYPRSTHFFMVCLRTEDGNIYKASRTALVKILPNYRR